MKRNRLFLRFIWTVLFVFSLSGCASSNDTWKTDSENTATPNKGETEVSCDFPTEVVNDKQGMEGGILKVALVTESAFAGVINPVFKEDALDNQIVSWMTEPIVSYDENFVADQDGAATYDYDKEAKTITLHMKKGVKWHDGKDVTLDDLVFAFEVLCHKDYEGMYYGESEVNIVGVEEYHNGAMDQISGLELSKDKMTLVIHFKEFYPSILAGGFWSHPIPRHSYEGIAVKEMAAHEKTRKNPIGYGPYKIKNIVPGESVELERFDEYWRGKPKLDGVEITVVNADLVPAAMKEGKFDIAEFSVQQYPDYMEPKNYQYIGAVQMVYGYTGFKLGKWDAEKNENISNPDAKMANLDLRKAIGYAVDNVTLANTLYHGLRFFANTVITPGHATYQKKDLVGYYYDAEQAKELLDRAGYKDVDGDGYREDPNGEQFTITWAHMEGENAETIAQFKIQCWADVGLRVELYNGRLTEFNAFYDAVQMDDPAIDMYDGAWQTGYDPNPTNIWGREASSNFARYTSENFDTIMKEIGSEKAWDSIFLTQKYEEWQEAFFEEAPAIPTLWRIEIAAVNDRVKNYNVTPSDVEQSLHLIELTDEATIK